MTGTRPPARRKKALRLGPEDLLSAAQEVFAEQGVAGASIRAIARRAACDPALIYYHFNNKEEIFEAIIDRFFVDLRAGLETLLQDSADAPTCERLGCLARLVMVKAGGGGLGLRCLIRGEAVEGAAGIRASLARRIRPVLVLVGSIFRDGMRRGELRPDLVPDLTPILFMRGLVDLLDLIPAMSENLVGEPPDAALPRALGAWFQLFWRGVAADPKLLSTHELESLFLPASTGHTV
jgi:AcrR family transcriptional regulator